MVIPLSIVPDASRRLSHRVSDDHVVAHVASFEILEQRIVPAIVANPNEVFWRGNVSSDFFHPGNWSGGTTPGAADVAVFDETAWSFVVDIGSSSLNIGGMRFRNDSTNTYQITGDALGYGGSIDFADCHGIELTSANRGDVVFESSLDLNASVAGTMVVNNSQPDGDLFVRGDVHLDTDLYITANRPVDIDGAILDGSGSGGLVKDGDDRLELDGINTFSGAINVLDGVLEGDVDSIATDVVLQSDSETNRYAFLVFDFDGSLEESFSHEISGSGDVVKTGNGTLVFDTNHLYAGATIIAEGTLVVDAGDAIGDVGTVIVHQDGNLVVRTSETIGSLHGSLDSVVTLELGTMLTVDVSLYNNATFAGDLDATATETLRKIGDGTLTLSPSTNSVGTIQVGAGVLQLDRTHTGNVTVNLGAALTGDGTVSGATSIVGGYLSPGEASAASPLGTHTTDVLNLAVGVLKVDLHGPTPVDHDLLVASTSVNLVGASLIPQLGFTPSQPETLIFIQNTGSSPVIGQFNGYLQGVPVVDPLGLYKYTLDYQAGDGNDVAIIIDPLVVLPPPPTVSSIVNSSRTLNSSSARAVVNFSAPVVGVDVSDFSLVRTGTATGRIASVTSNDPSGMSYVVELADLAGTGELRLRLNDNDSIVDSFSQALAGALNGSLTGPRILVDLTPPTLESITRRSSNADGETLDFVVQFSKEVTGVDARAFEVVSTGSAIASIVGVTAVDQDTYRVTIGNIGGVGTLGLRPASATTRIKDLAGNLMAPASGLLPDAYTINRLALQVASFELLASDGPMTDDGRPLINDATPTFRLVLSAGALASGDVRVQLDTDGDGGFANGAATVSLAGTRTVIDVTATQPLTDGPARVRARIVDPVGNELLTGEVLLEIDQSGPEVVEQRAEQLVEDGVAAGIRYFLTFDEVVSPPDFGSLNLVGTDASGNEFDASVALSVAMVDADQWVVEAFLGENGFPSGSYRLEVEPSMVTDRAGNPLGSPSSISFFFEKATIGIESVLIAGPRLDQLPTHLYVNFDDALGIKDSDGNYSRDGDLEVSFPSLSGGSVSATIGVEQEGMSPDGPALVEAQASAVDGEVLFTLHFDRSLDEDEALRALNYELTRSNGERVALRNDQFRYDAATNVVTLRVSDRGNVGYTLAIDGRGDLDIDPATATDLSNYLLERLVEQPGGGSQWVPVELSSPLYSQDGDRVILVPAAGTEFALGRYRLTITGIETFDGAGLENGSYLAELDVALTEGASGINPEVIARNLAALDAVVSQLTSDVDQAVSSVLSSNLADDLLAAMRNEIAANAGADSAVIANVVSQRLIDIFQGNLAATFESLGFQGSEFVVLWGHDARFLFEIPSNGLKGGRVGYELDGGAQVIEVDGAIFLDDPASGLSLAIVPLSPDGELVATGGLTRVDGDSVEPDLDFKLLVHGASDATNQVGAMLFGSDGSVSQKVLTDTPLGDAQSVGLEATGALSGIDPLLQQINNLVIAEIESILGPLSELQGQFLIVWFDPVGATLTDSNGRRIGAADGQSFNEIPGAYYSGDGENELWVIPNSLAGDYQLTLVGDGTSYRGGINLVSDGTVSTTLLGGSLPNGTFGASNQLALVIDFDDVLPTPSPSNPAPANPQGDGGFVSSGGGPFSLLFGGLSLLRTTSEFASTLLLNTTSVSGFGTLESGPSTAGADIGRNRTDFPTFGGLLGEDSIVDEVFSSIQRGSLIDATLGRIGLESLPATRDGIGQLAASVGAIYSPKTHGIATVLQGLAGLIGDASDEEADGTSGEAATAPEANDSTSLDGSGTSFDAEIEAIARAIAPVDQDDADPQVAMLAAGMLAGTVAAERSDRKSPRPPFRQRPERSV
ncbi:Autotransporter-associated beta strand repeat protein [Planctomycetes bacterium Pan216]|uniref:Autotransporter-associated beta strand repeat protein n=1 Tax=Kolteria novifilia TaxID=2527975 RepID=A0A518BB80_9BACT|nr:Autotransporter-associated beta strand repeat protein [Planctomycetes bacterium Pan216]